jgi:hypothetical protein
MSQSSDHLDSTRTSRELPQEASHRSLACLGLCAATLVPYPSGGASADYVSNRFRSHPNIRTLNHVA